MEIDGRAVRVSASAHDVALELRRQLRGRTDDLVGSAALGVSIETARDGSPFHWVRWGGCRVTRTRDPLRAVAALDVTLAEATRPTPDQVRMPSRWIVSEDGGAVLLPPEADEHLLRVERALRARGAVVADSRATTVEPRSGQVVVADARLDPEPLVALLAGGSAAAPEGFVGAGRYDVIGRLEGSEAAPLSRRVVSCIGPDVRLSESLLDDLVRLLQHVPWRCVPEWRPSVVMQAVTSLQSPPKRANR